MSVNVRIVELGTLSTLVSLHDPANGKRLLREVALPRIAKRQARIKSARASGSYGVGAVLPDDGSLTVSVRFEGSSWVQATTRANAALDVLEALFQFYVEVEQDGVVTRWYSDAPVDMMPAPMTRESRLLNRHDYDLTFLVQPNPSVTIV